MKYYEQEMPTIHPEGYTMLTWEDAERMEKRNSENGWGFSTPSLLHMLATHMDAQYAIEENHPNKDNAILEQEKIEWRLTDANFHTFCETLHDGNYATAFKLIEEDFIGVEVGE